MTEEDAQCELLASHQAHTHEHIYTWKNIKEALGFVKNQVTNNHATYGFLRYMVFYLQTMAVREGVYELAPE